MFSELQSYNARNESSYLTVHLFYNDVLNCIVNTIPNSDISIHINNIQDFVKLVQSSKFFVHCHFILKYFQTSSCMKFTKVS